LAIREQTLVLDPSGAIFWEQQQTLMVADLHLGREMSLQKAGVAIPQGASARTIEKLAAQMQHHQAANLLILGDLIHARCSWTDELIGIFLKFCESVAGRCQLIEGNHDRGSKKQLTRFPLEVLQPPIFQNPFWLLHDPDREFPLIERDTGFANEGQRDRGNRQQSERAQSTVSDREISNPIALAGHLHPGFRLPHTREQVKCFYRKGDVLILPSFGELTGSRTIHPLKNDQLFLLGGGSVIPWQGN
jgi:metallophosphoesterase superfamily enzyme